MYEYCTIVINKKSVKPAPHESLLITVGCHAVDD